MINVSAASVYRGVVPLNRSPTVTQCPNKYHRNAKVITRRLQTISILCFLAFAACSPAQTITLRLANGKTGKPFTKKNLNVTFWWQDSIQPEEDKWTQVDGSFLGTDAIYHKTGVAHIPLPPQATRIEVREGSKIGKEPSMIPYFDCNGHMPQMIPVTDVLERGFIASNECSKNLRVKVSPENSYF